MSKVNFSAQAWQVEPTESMWSILRRFIALDRPNQKQCMAATGRALEPVGASQWLLYRDVGEINRYRRIQQTLGLTERQMRMATLPLLATLPENNMAIRYCRLCMEKGFHSSVFQIPWVERCPVHAQKLVDQCWVCRTPITARWDRWLVVRAPYQCQCRTNLGNPLGTALQPMREAERESFYDVYRNYEDAYNSVSNFAISGRSRSLLTHWELMQRCINLTEIAHRPSISAIFDEVYTAEGEGGSKALAGKLKSRLTIQLSNKPYATQAGKAFRRHLEKSVPMIHRRSIKLEKAGLKLPRSRPMVHKGLPQFMTWKLFWDHVTEARPRPDRRLLELQEDRCITPPRWSVDEAGAPHYIDRFYSHNEIISQSDERSAYHAEVLNWSYQHAFSFYLISLRDEAETLANALVDYDFLSWKYSSTLLLGRLAAAFTVTVSNETEPGVCRFIAWRSSEARRNIDFDCQATVWNAKNEWIKRRMEIESLRDPNDRSYNSDLEVQRVLDAIGYTSVDLCTLQKRTQIELSRLKSILRYLEWIDLVTRRLGGRFLCRCMVRSQKIAPI